jgi:bla regulator protein blaR1
MGVAVMVASLAVSVGTEQAADSPSFEAASVKPNKSGDRRTAMIFQPGGRFNATNVTLQMLISTAYGTPQPLPSFQIIGGPDWIDADRFDVVAKAPGDIQPGPDGPLPLMVRTLLKERFGLVVHTETRDLPVYALVMARSDRKTGSQLKPAAVDCAAIMARGRGGQPPLPPQPGERPPCGIRLTPGDMAGGGMSIAQFAFAVARYVNRPVLNKTELAGNFDFDLRWTPEQMPPAGPPGPPGAPAPPAIDPNGPSIFTAVQEQLGLKLESTKGPVDVVVIDRAEHPTED